MIRARLKTGGAWTALITWWPRRSLSILGALHIFEEEATHPPLVAAAWVCSSVARVGDFRGTKPRGAAFSYVGQAFSVCFLEEMVPSYICRPTVSDEERVPRSTLRTFLLKPFLNTPL